MHDGEGNVVASDCGVQLKVTAEATDETSSAAEEAGLLGKSETNIKGIPLVGGAADPEGAAGQTYYFGSDSNVPAKDTWPILGRYFREEWLVSSPCPRVCLLSQHLIRAPQRHYRAPPSAEPPFVRDSHSFSAHPRARPLVRA